MKRTLLISFFILIIVELYAQPCKDLPKSFHSYNKAISKVKNAKFKIEDKVDCAKSSWIQKASYHSCDGKTGYFILATKKGKEYIHQGMPINVWKKFKNADSLGNYYNNNIKGRYTLQIE